MTTPIYQGALIGSPAYQGFTYAGSVVFTDDDTFVKADYPGLRAVVVHCQGGGGGGGGAGAVGSGEVSMGAGAPGGGYARKLVLARDLAESETVTVGGGGVGGPSGANDGANGEHTTFGAHCQGNRGVGGVGMAARSAPTSMLPNPSSGGSGTGDVVVPGSASSHAIAVESGTADAVSSAGGDSLLGAGGRSVRGGGSASGPGIDGYPGEGPGGGGGGGICVSSQTGAAGGDGSPGLVVVELYL